MHVCLAKHLLCVISAVQLVNAYYVCCLFMQPYLLTCVICVGVHSDTTCCWEHLMRLEQSHAFRLAAIWYATSVMQVL